MRGKLTEALKKKGEAFLGREFTQKELRLYPYIDYCIKNNCQGWSFSKMNATELDIIDQLEEDGCLVYSAEKVVVSRAFYNFMQDMLAESYVENFLDVEL